MLSRTSAGARRRLGGLVRFAFGSLPLVLVASGCASGKPPPNAAAATDEGPVACAADETREYYCDDLLPFSPERAAPEPYQTCPRDIPVQGNVFPTSAKQARFDEARTVWTRKRVPPGHSCCYSVCSKIALASPSDADATACTQPNAMPERLCLSEPEAGSSESAAAPYDKCPEAVAPPRGVAFSAPKAALLDPTATAQQRSQGVNECCYGWCSRAPLGTGLGSR